MEFQLFTYVPIIERIPLKGRHENTTHKYSCNSKAFNASEKSRFVGKKANKISDVHLPLIWSRGFDLSSTEKLTCIGLLATCSCIAAAIAIPGV